MKECPPFHGAQKVLRILSDFQPAIGSQLWIGGVIELVGGLAIMVGYQTAIAAFLCSGEMAVAYFQNALEISDGRQFLSGDQQRRTGRSLLFCVPLYCIPRRGQMVAG